MTDLFAEAMGYEACMFAFVTAIIIGFCLGVRDIARDLSGRKETQDVFEKKPSRRRTK